MNKYLSKQIDSLNNTISFQLERCQWLWSQYIGQPSNYSTAHDTIQETVPFHGNFDQIPLEPYLENDMAFLNYKKDSVGFKYDLGYFMQLYNGDTLNAFFYDGIFTTIYYNGFGTLFTSYDMMGTTSQNNFVYYNINNVVWGAPYICDSLLSSYEKPISTNNIIIFPNPADHYFKIDGLKADKYQLEISDIQGRIVYNELIEKDINHINITEIPNGMYILHLWSKEERTCSKLLIQH